MNGYICSGYKRRPHLAIDLTADHPMPTSKGGDEYQDLMFIVVVATAQNKHHSDDL